MERAKRTWTSKTSSSVNVAREFFGDLCEHEGKQILILYHYVEIIVRWTVHSLEYENRGYLKETQYVVKMECLLSLALIVVRSIYVWG